MSTNGERVYRPVEPSDLPRIQAGTLKAFCRQTHAPVQFLTTRYSSYGETIFLAKGQNYDFLLRLHEVVVDVTPEKRYAIWNHSLQRFNRSQDSDLVIFPSKAEGEAYIQEMVKKYTLTEKSKKNYYVVEWEVKDEL